ncbi:MAG: ABC transporter ATP-binding protein [Candidatus Gastranaerophilales bacterium]|nr:ABC transporter ATP-binding protein [Candidatus Gastranaerophilales bacterium]
MSILEIKNLNLFFHSDDKYYQALHNINMQLESGEMLAVVGESGCGKSVTAMSILRLLAPNAHITSGEILYNGQNLLKFSENEMLKIRGKEIALVPQDPMTSLNPLYTIGSQLLEVIETHQNLKGTEARNKAIDVLNLVKIPNAKERLNAYPHEFSGGMRQRVIIAMALACKSKIIIADEPTTALDVTVQAQIMELLKDIQNNTGTSFIFISHDFGLVYEAADRTCVMYAGHIVENASSFELFKNPKHPYTKALIKTLPDFNSTKLEPIEGQPPSIKDSFAGCPFEPRCSKRMEICKTAFPPCFTRTDSCVSCWLFKK